MRVGVLTLHSCINYGSFWQAWHLVHGLRALGFEAVVLDHRSRRTARAERLCALDPVQPTATSAADRALYRRKITAFRTAVRSLPRSKPFDLEMPGAMERCEVIVIGSDEVWNLRHPWYGGYGAFFGEGVQADRVVSYGATFGSYAADDGLSCRWRRPLAALDAVSVRDGNSFALVAAAGRSDVELVLDPCLQFTEELTPLASSVGRPLVAVYGHNFSANFVANVRRWARRNRYALVSIGYRNDWADEQWLDAGPHDFAATVGRAAAVATNFFHGCVFALRAHKPLVCELMRYRAHKVTDLMRVVGGERHVVDSQTSPAAFESLLREPPDDLIGERVAARRRAAGDFLAAALA